MENNERLARDIRGYFMGPFDVKGDYDAEAVFQQIVRPAAELAGISVSRADQLAGHGLIADQMFESIDAADILVADVTGNNLNVIFELANARAAGRGIVVLHQKSAPIPFSLSQYQVIPFDNPSDLSSTTAAIHAVSEALRAHLREGRNRGYSPFPSIRRLQEQEYAREGALESLNRLREERVRVSKRYRRYDVFISYSRADRPLAERLERYLRKRWVSVWFDRRLDATPGVDFTAEIEGTLTFARRVIVLWSANSQSSTWVFAEATLARQAGTYLPVQAQPCEIPSAFRDLHCADLGEFFASGATVQVRGLVKSIRAKRV